MCFVFAVCMVLWNLHIIFKFFNQIYSKLNASLYLTTTADQSAICSCKLWNSTGTWDLSRYEISNTYERSFDLINSTALHCFSKQLCSFCWHYLYSEDRKAVFFNLFAAGNLQQMFVLLMEPYAMTQVSILLQPHRTVVVNFVPGNFSLFRRNPWQPLAEPWGSAEPRLKNTV